MKENKKPLALYQISSVPIMPMVLSILGKLGITVLVSVISSYVLSTTENKINDTPFWMNIGQYIKIGVCIICIGLLAYTIIHCIRKGTVTWWLNIIICALFVGAVIAGLPFDALYKLANRNTAILSGLGIVIGAIGSNASKPDKKQYWTIAILLCLAFCVITVTIQTVYTRVPGVVGKTVDEAETILLEKDIGIKLEKGEIGIQEWTNQGITYRLLTSKMHEKLRFPSEVKGIIVSEIKNNNSPMLTLAVGDVIMQVNDEEISSIEDYQKVIKNLKSNNKTMAMFHIYKPIYNSIIVRGSNISD